MFPIGGWFLDNKLRIHFGEEKIKCILFVTKHRLNKFNSPEIKYGEIHIMQYHTVIYFLVACWMKLFLGSQWL